MKKCLVLGGTGFIGNHLCNRLILEGYYLKVLSNKGINHSSKNIEYITGDFCCLDDYKSIIENVDIIFHLISTTIPSRDTSIIVEEIECNIVNTIKLLECAVKTNVKKIIFISSGGTVYGIPQYLPIDENHPTNPISAYGIQKLAIEKYLFLYSHLHGIDYRIIRISNPYGNGQSSEKTQGVIPIFLNKIVNNETIQIWGDGEVVRDYIYIDDAIEGIIKVTNSNSVLNVYNIGSGQGTSLLELLNILKKLLNIDCIDVRFHQDRSIDVPVNILDITRANRELGWYPSYTLEHGIRKMLLEQEAD